MAASTRSRPRWFAPVLLFGLLVATICMIGVGALLYSTTDGEIEVGDRTFIVPPEELSALRREPFSFVRIRPAGKPFNIVHDQRTADGRDPAGVPYIFSINDGDRHSLVYDRQGKSIVVCRRASAPVGGCGTWIVYGGTTWSVLFSEANAGQADKFARDALRALRRYDKATRSLVP